MTSTPEQQLCLDEEAAKQETGRTSDILKQKKCRIFLAVGAILLVLAITVPVGVHFGKSDSGQNPTTTTPSYFTPGRLKESCILQDTHEYRENENRFGELCNKSSHFVAEECAKSGAKFKCDTTDKLACYLPNYCFCDNFSHCIQDTKAFDDWKDKTCEECSSTKSCPCLHGGVCKCNDKFDLLATSLTCDCPKGYTGKYCEYGPPRLCYRNSTIPKDLEYCRRTNKDQCYIYSSAHNFETMVCAILKDDSEAHGREQCVVN